VRFSSMAPKNAGRGEKKKERGIERSVAGQKGGEEVWKGREKRERRGEERSLGDAGFSRLSAEELNKKGEESSLLS